MSDLHRSKRPPQRAIEARDERDDVRLEIRLLSEPGDQVRERCLDAASYSGVERVRTYEENAHDDTELVLGGPFRSIWVIVGMDKLVAL